MAYIVGLMATDGNLSRDGRHLSFDSGDLQLIHTYLSCLGHPYAHTRIKWSGLGGMDYQVQFSDVRFHRWLRGIGLMPRKSLILGGIDVPDEFLHPTLRGLFEGGGHISNFTHRPTVRTYPNYEYERLWVYFNSASRRHLEWVHARVAQDLSLNGSLEKLPDREGRHDFFRLKYGNHDSVVLLSAMYPNADVPKLERKWRIWADYQSRNR